MENQRHLVRKNTLHIEDKLHRMDVRELVSFAFNIIKRPQWASFETLSKKSSYTSSIVMKIIQIGFPKASVVMSPVN